MDSQDTTSSWASRRKFIYTAATVGLLTLVSTFIFWKYWYVEPTCFDGLQNGNETGRDCGGSCSLVCSAEALAPVIRSDPRIFQIYPGVYSLLTFVENHNVDSSSNNAPYTFRIYDAKGKVIAERAGSVKLTKNRTAAIFEGNVNATGTPARVSFELGPQIRWEKDATKLPELRLTHSPLLNEETAPRIEASIENESLETIENIQIVAVVLDGKDNAIAASRTFVDRLDKDQDSDVFFTWPRTFDLGENFCEKPSAIEILIDRSGSMSSLGKNPPQPLTDVKAAAQSFVSLLREEDKAGFISFATEASNPIEMSLTNDFEALSVQIGKLNIATSSTQYTNIRSALLAAREDLKLVEDKETRKVIVLLTDGIPNRPASTKQGATEAEDIAYAEAEALSQASLAKAEGITLFTIGLGKDLHEDFLRQVATTQGTTTNYFGAPNAKDLSSIYQKISSSICKEAPARIEMFVSF